MHDEAVFGHFSTFAAAKKLKKHAAAFGFAGIKIENEGCGDFEVEIDGADRQADRSSFAQEASKAGFPVTFEQIAPPMQYQQGQVVGVLGQMRTVAAANSLMMRGSPATRSSSSISRAKAITGSSSCRRSRSNTRCRSHTRSQPPGSTFSSAPARSKTRRYTIATCYRPFGLLQTSLLRLKVA